MQPDLWWVRRCLVCAEIDHRSAYGAGAQLPEWSWFRCAWCESAGFEWVAVSMRR